MFPNDVTEPSFLIFYCDESFEFFFSVYRILLNFSAFCIDYCCSEGLLYVFLKGRELELLRE